MIRREVLGGAVLLLLGAPSGGALDPPVTLTASADATLYEEVGVANGGGQHLFTGLTVGGRARRSLVRFDLASAFPPGTTVEFARLYLTVDRTISGPSQITLHRVTQSWGEGSADADSGGEGGGAPAGVGDATWLDRFHPDVAWSQAGGDFVSTPSALATAGGPADVVLLQGPQLVADVTSWIEDPSSNHGWIVLGDEATIPSAKRFGSREASDPSTAPILVLAGTPPPIPTLSPLGVGLWGLLLVATGVWRLRGPSGPA